VESMRAAQQRRRLRYMVLAHPPPSHERPLQPPKTHAPSEQTWKEEQRRSKVEASSSPAKMASNSPAPCYHHRLAPLHRAGRATSSSVRHQRPAAGVRSPHPASALRTTRARARVRSPCLQRALTSYNAAATAAAAAAAAVASAAVASAARGSGGDHQPRGPPPPTAVDAVHHRSPVRRTCRARRSSKRRRRRSGRGRRSGRRRGRAGAGRSEGGAAGRRPSPRTSRRKSRFGGSRPRSMTSFGGSYGRRRGACGRRRWTRAQYTPRAHGIGLHDLTALTVCAADGGARCVRQQRELGACFFGMCRLQVHCEDRGGAARCTSSIRHARTQNGSTTHASRHYRCVFRNAMASVRASSTMAATCGSGESSSTEKPWSVLGKILRAAHEPRARAIVQASCQRVRRPAAPS